MPSVDRPRSLDLGQRNIISRLPPKSTGFWYPDIDEELLPLPTFSEIASAYQFQVVPANQFTMEQLTDAYNQTRVDYMVPMPMNVARLVEYVHVYDVDIGRSVVAMDDDQVLGLGMLGVRTGCTWITRLGVVPGRRRRGVGEAVLLYLLAASEQIGIDLTTLDVIRGNSPAHRLFLKWGFHETRELIILRRPPGPSSTASVGQFRWLDKAEAVELTDTRPRPISWLNAVSSLSNSDHVMGLTVTLPDGSYGWLVFQKKRFILTRLTIRTVKGDPIAVGRALFAQLYEKYPNMDSNMENVSTSNPHLPAFFDVGFVESFRRVEMYRVTHPSLAHAARLVRGDVALRRALIVDHEEAKTLSIRDNLKTLSNCDITITTSGEQAWQLFEQRPFDLLVTDYKMPGADGMTLVERVRQSYPRTSIILTTAPG
ncbi:MAG: GNAT family N-acetyltransferase [Chloroflexi bacterium]|nr:GNAT family N-acetyltransferase [Chloroflexota bacterium]